MFKYNHIKYSSVLPILVLLLAHSLCLLANQSADSKNKAGEGASLPPPRSPMGYFDLGPFRFELFANTTQYQDKTRLSKSYLELVIRSKIFGANSPPLSTVKIGRLEELVRCENLTLAKADMEPLVDCRPLESYVQDGLHEKVSSSNSKDKKSSQVMYAGRWTFRAKAKSPFLDDEGFRQDFVMYPLRDDVVRFNVNSILAANNLSSADLADSVSVQYGFYLETEVPTIIGNLRCTANVFTSFNGGTASEPTAESVVQELVDLFNGVSRDGFFYSIQDASCGQADAFIPFSVDQNFTLAVRNKFPYVTFKHNIVTKPIERLWTYSAKIGQTRDETHPLNQGEQPKAYKTSLWIESVSALSDALSFELGRDVVIEGDQSGSEQTFLLQNALAVVMRGNWTADSLFRMLYIDPLSDKSSFSNQKTYHIKLEPAIVMVYQDEPDDDYVRLTLRVKRKFYRQLIGGAKASHPDEGREGDEADSHESAERPDGHGQGARRAGADDGTAPRTEL